MRIDMNDETTPLSELSEELGWDSTLENAVALVMVMCERFEKLEKRITVLEDNLVYELNEGN